LEGKLAEDILDDVVKRPKTINKYIRRYEEYCQIKIVDHLELSNLFQSTLDELLHIKNPKLKADIKMLEIQKKADPEWHKNYKKYLNKYRTIKKKPNLFLNSERKTVKELLHVFITKAKEFNKKGFWKGAILKCDQALEIIEDYKGLYNLKSTEKTINNVKIEALSRKDKLESVAL
jgi:hypothetical protein